MNATNTTSPVGCQREGGNMIRNALRCIAVVGVLAATRILGADPNTWTGGRAIGVPDWEAKRSYLLILAILTPCTRRSVTRSIAAATVAGPGAGSGRSKTSGRCSFTPRRRRRSTSAARTRITSKDSSGAPMPVRPGQEPPSTRAPPRSPEARPMRPPYTSGAGTGSLRRRTRVPRGFRRSTQARSPAS